MTRTITLATTSVLLVVITMLGASSYADAAIYMKIEGIPGDVTVRGYEGSIELNSFSVGVDRENKRSGEKGGTEDINIGIGELQEVSIAKSLDSASAKLAQFAINGNSLGQVEIHFVKTAGPETISYLQYKLDRAFVKSWSTSGDADDRPTEEVAFYYNKISFAYTPGGIQEPDNVMSWDIKKKTTWDVIVRTILGALNPFQLQPQQ
jgi:type VI secretion system secreted protein Hcp